MLGSIILHENDLKDHNICGIIKILGVSFGYDEKQRNDLNFQQTLKSIKKSFICGNGGTYIFWVKSKLSKLLHFPS